MTLQRKKSKYGGGRKHSVMIKRSSPKWEGGKKIGNATVMTLKDGE